MVFPVKECLFISCILLFLSLFFAHSAASAELTPCPDFSLSDLSGRIHTLSEHRNRLLVLDFWATWCPPCRAAIPEHVAIQKKYQERELLILGISMDDPRKVSDEDLRGFIMKYQINYPILRYNQRLLVDYFNGEIPAIPVTFIVDREGRIVEKFTGYRPGALEKKVLQLMRK